MQTESKRCSVAKLQAALDRLNAKVPLSDSQEERKTALMFEINALKREAA